MAAFDAVLFDYGGVFTASPFHAVGAHGRQSGTDPRLLVDVIFGPYETDTDHPWHRLERGEIPLGDAIEQIVAIGRDRGIDVDPAGFFGALARSGTGGVHDTMVECARRLRREGLSTALVTNNAAEFRDAWRRTLPLDELFHLVVDSSEEGVRKPDPRIFTRTLERLGGVTPERSVFLDDHPGNVAAAERVGIRGLLVGPDPSEAVAELERLLRS